MEELLEQFDPLSIKKEKRKPINSTKTTTTNIRSSSNTLPIFTSNQNNNSSNHSSNNNSNQINNNNSNQINHNPNQKWKIKPPTDSLNLNDQDPLGFLNTQSNSKINQTNQLKHKPSDLFQQAQIRSKLRQDALAKHLAHEPFQITSPTIQNLEIQDQTPLINLVNEETVTCLNSIQSSSNSSIPTSPIVSNNLNLNNSIKIPSELFQNKLNKNKKQQHTIETNILNRTEPKITKPVDEHKLAAALLEGFDDFVSASPNLSSPTSFQPSSELKTHHTTLKFHSHLNTPSPTQNNNNKNFDSSGHSTPLSSFEGHEGIPNSIQFIGINPQSQLVMDDELAEGIRLNLPNRLKISSQWKLIYSIDQDGSSLSTLYSKLDQTTGGFGSNDSTRAGFILVLKDHLGRRFGGFVNEPFRPSKEYYGSGECFLWKAIEFGPDDFRIGVAIKAYNWTGINDYMILSDHDLLSIGGGDGKFGLWIDSNLLKGSSTKCPAFNNEILCSSCISSNPSNNKDSNLKNNDEEEGSFDVIGLECWMVSV